MGVSSCNVPVFLYIVDDQKNNFRPMKKIDLTRYALERFREKEKEQEPGPVVTISRQYGCPSKPVAEALTRSINNYVGAKGKRKSWSWISKELLKETANELQMHPSKIEHVFNYEERNLFDEILAAQSSKYYASDRKIRKTIGQVIHSIAHEGNVVIVGRAGAVITREIQQSLHIRLIAPLKWRVNRIMGRFNLTEEEALKRVEDIDRKRKQFMKYFYGKEYDDSLFDMVFNSSTLSQDMIVESILTMMIMKQLV